MARLGDQLIAQLEDIRKSRANPHAPLDEQQYGDQIGKLRYDAMIKVFLLLGYLPPGSIDLLERMWTLSKPKMQAELILIPEITMDHRV